MESKTLNMTKLVLLSIIAIVLILILAVLLYRPRDFSFFSFGEDESKLVFDEVYEDDITSLYAWSTSGDIEINETNEDRVSVKVYGKDDKKLNVKVEGNKLSVVEESRHFCIGFCFNVGYRIVIDVPKSREYDVELHSISGNVKMDDILTKNASVKTVSGDIHLRDFDEIKVESVSGDIKIFNVNIVNAKTVSGEISIDNINGKAKIKTTSGDVEISDLNITSDSSISTVSGDVEIGRTNSYIKTSTISGEIDIKNNDRRAEVETSISTTSGDIEVRD